MMDVMDKKIWSHKTYAKLPSLKQEEFKQFDL